MIFEIELSRSTLLLVRVRVRVRCEVAVELTAEERDGGVEVRKVAVELAAGVARVRVRDEG